MESKYKWLWLFLFLTMLGFLNIGVIATDDMANGDKVHWLRYFINELSGEWIMLPLLVPILWFFKNFPINRDNIYSRLPLHLMVTVIFGAIHTLLMYVIRTPLYKIFGLGTYSQWYGILGYRFIMEYFKQFIFYWVFYGGYTLIKQMRDQQSQRIHTAQLEQQLTKARLQSLQMQLNPHFLFNTLNAISSIMYVDLQAADQMMSNLSDMLRATFRIQKEEHPVIQEIELLKHYVDIMQIRFKGKLNMHFSITPSSESALIPVFLLQPLLENAIKYGVERKEGVNIELKTSVEKDQLRIELSDNGPGIQKAVQSGIGWENTLERLESLFEDRYVFELINRDEGGLKLIIEIPKHFH